MAPSHTSCSSVARSSISSVSVDVSGGAVEVMGRVGAESEDRSEQDACDQSHPVLRTNRVRRTLEIQITTESSSGAECRADEARSCSVSQTSDTVSSSGEEENCSNDGCETPKLKRHRISQEFTDVPLAPKKPRAIGRKRVKPLSFFTPAEFDSFLPFHRTKLQLQF